MLKIKESNSLSLKIPEEEYQVELNKIRNSPARRWTNSVVFVNNNYGKM